MNEIEWKKTGPEEAVIDGVRAEVIGNDWCVRQTRDVAFGGGIVIGGTAPSHEEAKSAAASAAALVRDLVALGAWSVYLSTPRIAAAEVNMVAAKSEVCSLCGEMRIDKECYHPAGEVRDAFALIMRVPRSR